jgi:hypothetical protein
LVLTGGGTAGAKLLHSKYSEFAGNQSHISVRFFEHTWPQPSVIARIEGTGTRHLPPRPLGRGHCSLTRASRTCVPFSFLRKGENAHELVILGGHEDSVGFSTTGRSPGADDDGA